MKLFSSTQISWSEPWFFLVRIRERPSWTWRIILGFVLSLALFVGMYLGGRHVNWGLPQLIGFSLFCGYFLVALLDVPHIQREVTIKEDGIICGTSIGKGHYTSFDLNDILSVELLRPEDWNRPWGAMLIENAGDTFLAAVPRKVSLATVANILHRLGVAVALREWEPSAADTRIQVQDEVVIPPEAVRGVANIRPVEPGEPRLTPPAAIAVSITIALGPALLSFIALIAGGIYIAMGWSTLGLVTKLVIGGSALAAFVVSVVWLIYVGQFLAASYAVGVGGKQLRLRVGSLYRGDEADLIPVEVYDRTAWTSVLAKSIDSGFLQIDPNRRMLRFEGDKNRWEIPTNALTACRIAQSHVGSEANQNAEKRYYVTLATTHADEPWEVGLTQTRTEIGSDGPDKRSARAQFLFRQIAGGIQV